MKKVFVVVLSLALAIVCLACGPQNDRNEDVIPSSSNTATTTNGQTETDAVENPLTMDLTQKFKDERTGYKLKFKWRGMHSSNGYEYLLRDVDRCMVFSKYFDGDIVNTTDKDNIKIENIKTTEDIITEMIPYKVKSLLERGMPLETVAEATYEAGETITVDGCEATRFTGDLVYTMAEDDFRECTVVGYAIMGSKRPMLIWATDISKDHGYMEELTDLVDRIILTFEDEPEGEED
ncbi:MAG: hypothetical protein LBK75_01720 [Oscillospiraceae bacterium]|nr:hypothetical protein [Oscillospiraceae bacterium]